MPDAVSAHDEVGVTQSTSGGVHGTYVPVIDAVRGLAAVTEALCTGIAHHADCDRKCEERFKRAAFNVVQKWEGRNG